MPDPIAGAPGQNGTPPTDSPPVNEVPGAGAPPPGGAQPSASVPFNNDLAVQDYIDRQVEARLQSVLSRFAPAAPATRADEGDPLDQIAQELAREEEIKPEVAKSFVQKFKRIADHTMKDLNARLDQYELTQKFSQVFAKYEDAEALAPRMTNTWKGLNELERNFVLKSPDGADYLYNRARREANAGALPPQIRNAAGNPPGRSASPDSKVGSKAALFAKANELRAKGDRKGYEEVFQQIIRG